MTLWRGGLTPFLTMTWPLLFGRLFASEGIYPPASFKTCQRDRFWGGVQGGPTS
jgi:hypothetical protein